MPNGSPDAAQLSECERFYGLSSRPFSLTPDLRFAFHSRSHSRALSELSEALRRREGVIVITGEIGTGKTMLCRAVMEVFEPRTFLSVILDPRLTADELLRQVLKDFGLVTEAGDAPAGHQSDVSRHQLVSTLQQFLASLISLNAHAVIIIDEAQHLHPDVLEEIRLLSNFETDEAKLLQVVLVGQPDLDALLRRPDLRQVAQRVARRLELHPLSGTEVQEYIDWRLSVAARNASGQAQGIFTGDAVKAIAAISGGIPRVINIVSDRALEIGCGRQSRTIDAAMVHAAATQLKLGEPATATSPVRRRRMTGMAAAIAIIAVVGALGWWVRENRGTGAPVARHPPATNQPAAAAARPPTATPPAPANTAAGAAGGIGPRPATSPPAGTTAGAVRPSAASPPSSSATAAGTVTARPPAPPAGANGTRYNITVAAFRTEARATEVAAALSAKSLRVSTRSDPSSPWHIVIAGPYTSADEAETARQALIREGFADARISATPASGR